MVSVSGTIFSLNFAGNVSIISGSVSVFYVTEKSYALLSAHNLQMEISRKEVMAASNIYSLNIFNPNNPTRVEACPHQDTVILVMVSECFICTLTVC